MTVITNIPINILKPDQIIRRVLDREQLRAYKRLTREYSPISQITRNLASYLTEMFPADHPDHNTLLALCIVNALHGWHMPEKSRHEKKRFVSYMKALVYYLPRVLEYEVYMEGEKRVIWDPFEEKLSVWRKQNQAIPQFKYRGTRLNPRQAMMSSADYRLLIIFRFVIRDVIPTKLIACDLDQVTSRFY